MNNRIMDLQDSQEVQISHIASEIMSLERNRIYTEMRFFSSALFQLKAAETRSITFGTDGEYLFYNPVYTTEQFKKSNNRFSHIYLHTILHCLLHHMFFRTPVDQELWNLACDIVVEKLLADLDINVLDFRKEDKKRDAFRELCVIYDLKSTDQVYNFLQKNNYEREYIKSIQKVFCADDHSIWYSTEDEKNGLPINSDDFNVANNKELKRFLKERAWTEVSKQVNKKLNSLNNAGKTGLFEYNLLRHLSKLHDDRSDWLIKEILEGSVSEETIENAAAIDCENKITLVKRLVKIIENDCYEFFLEKEILKELKNNFKSIQKELQKPDAYSVAVFEKQYERCKEEFRNPEIRFNLSIIEMKAASDVLDVLLHLSKTMYMEQPDIEKAETIMGKEISRRKASIKERKENCKREIENSIGFIEKAFSEWPEMTVFLTKLITNKYTYAFLGQQGSDKFFIHSKNLMHRVREKEIRDELEGIRE